MSDRPSKARILVEGAVIVASILLAFTIDRVYENARDRGEESAILEGLRADFEANQLALEDYLGDYTRTIESSGAVLDYVRLGEGHADLFEVARSLGTLYSNRTFDPQTATLDLVESSGRGSLLTDGELRRLVAEWRVHWEDALDQQQGLQRYREGILWPAMIGLDLRVSDGVRRAPAEDPFLPHWDDFRDSDLPAALDLFSGLAARTLLDLNEVMEANDKVLARLEVLLGR